MKTFAKVIGLTATGIFLLSACSVASDLEKSVEDKISSLENKVSSLEGSAESGAEKVIDTAPVIAAPIGVSAQPGNAQATVAWNAPVSDGSAPITGYTVSSNPGGFTCSTTGTKSCTVTGLVNDTEYSFTVMATTSLGSSVASAASNSVTPQAPIPGAPVGVSARAANGSVTVSWSPPADDGGEQITGYTVSSQPGGFTCTTSAATSCVVSGLVNDTRHTFTVTATTSLGTSAPSTPSNSVTPQVPVPSAPIGVSATTGVGQATVSWSPPATKNSSKISGYAVTSNPGGFTCTTTSKTKCIVSGLASGTEYTFTVTAKTSQAVSPPSVASNSVTTQATPSS